MSWLAAGCVFVGGGLGAALRWLVSLALNPLFISCRSARWR
jgi:fluoride ion exporter CrcB/FEX